MSHGTTSSPTDPNKKVKPMFSKTDTVHWDPTSVGLPKGWSLTNFSQLKG